jgi:transaldolase
MLRGRRLARLVKEDGLSGVTTNPSIFRKAITGSSDYDGQIRELAGSRLSPKEAFEALAIRDVQEAADLLRPLHEESFGLEGLVSLEVSPHLARRTEETIEEATRLWVEVDRPNLMIKIPGTAQGIRAIEECLVRGVSVNVTLLFSRARAAEVREAYLRALERRAAAGRSLSATVSVASFFLSRIDLKVDPWIEERAREADDPVSLRGLRARTAVACARLAYQDWKRVTGSERWRRFADAGALPQRLLWASTSAKREEDDDLQYVAPLIGPRTISTMPESTLEAFRDHGRVEPTLGRNVGAAETILQRLEESSVDLFRAAEELEEEGIEKFAKPFDELLGALAEKLRDAGSGS